MKLQSKLLLHSFVSILIALLIMSYVMVKMFNMQSTAETYSDTLLKVEQLNSSMVTFQQSLANFGRNSTENNRITVLNKYNETLFNAEFLEDVPSVIVNEKDKRRIDFIHDKINFIKEYMHIIDFSQENSAIESMQLSSKINGILNDIYLLKLSLNDQFSLLEDRNNKQIFSISVTSGVLLLIISSLFNLIITKRITKPIKQLNAYSKRIASGDLAIKEIHNTSKDEVGQLTNSFNVMKQNLVELIGRLKSNADELKDKNERINDSISYAKRIQETVIPSEQQLEEVFQEHFIIWRPRDVVGGDFYWYHRTQKGFYIAVGDCTGHGVPGALMTTLSISALDYSVDTDEYISPAAILERLNETLKKSLNQETLSGPTDDGLDIGLCYVEENTITYAGAKLSLFKKTAEEIEEFKGDRKSIGYRRTPKNYTYTNHIITGIHDASFYITTDGYIDQNGGNRNYSFGRSYFSKLIEDSAGLSLSEQKEFFESELNKFMGDEVQRDDITVLGFKV